MLTRKEGEKIMIGEDVVLTVLEVYGNRVRIGLEAPEDIRIHRKEVYDLVNQNGDKPKS